jgi:hypothetical protein
MQRQKTHWKITTCKISWEIWRKHSTLSYRHFWKATHCKGQRRKGSAEKETQRKTRKEEWSSKIYSSEKTIHTKSSSWMQISVSYLQEKNETWPYATLWWLSKLVSWLKHTKISPGSYSKLTILSVTPATKKTKTTA